MADRVKGVPYDGDHGRRLASQYETVASEALYGALMPGLPKAPASILDIGAGSGRDAAWFAGLGYTVLAVEPSATMRAEGLQRHSGSLFNWLADSLPELREVYRLGASFDVVLLSAVWQHVPPPDRSRAFRKLVTLLKPGGVIVISLRLGPSDIARSMYAVSTEEVEHLARAYGMSILNESRNGDQLGRGDISWVTLVLKLPDDGTGALPLLRHVILNDAKSSTYKLGLLRALARAADGSQGLARNVGDERVVLPLGLIALNWLRLYKPLVEADLPQTPTNRGIGGLGFAGEAWAGVQEIPAIE